MRMRELEEKSGISRTAIHHYRREGLLPPPIKTAANAALYDEGHVERLKLIRALRTEELGPFSLSAVRRIVMQISSGSNPAAAVALERVTGSLPDPGHRVSLPQLADDIGLEVETMKVLVEAEVLVPLRQDPLLFDAADAATARVCGELLQHTPLEAADLAPVGELIRELVRYEQTLEQLVHASTAEEGSSHLLMRAMTSLHAYLWARHSTGRA